jgi:phosphoribosylformimino-5-aminoimidazole carboxamide ribotide isomerase
MALIVIPSIDLRGGRVVRLQQGDYDRQLSYSADPVGTAGAFASAGAQWLHIVDLDGAKEGRPVQTELIAQVIRHGDLRTQVGGGVREREHVEQLLAAGAQRVVVGTKAVEDWAWFERLIAWDDARGRIVLALDARDGIVATRGWTGSSGQQAVEVAARVRGWPLAGILYTDVARDGMMQGPNLQQTRRLAEATDVVVIASGGVGTLEHIRQLKRLPIWGVIVGRSLYEGTVDLPEALRVAREDSEE